MNKKEKQLLLIDICGRLPYGFTIHRYDDNCDITFEENKLDEFSHFLEYSDGKCFKPYLRPMSSMTKEEKKEYDKLFTTLTTKDCNFGKWLLPENDFKLIDFYNSHHFDYRGLIPMGLALEAKEGMY